MRVAAMADQIIEKQYDDYSIYCGVDEDESVIDFRDAGLPARKAIVTPGSRKYTFEWLQCRTIVIDPVRTPRAYKEIIEYEHEIDGNGEVIADYPDGNDHWIDALRYSISPIAMRRGHSA
nr:MAG TPA: terminase RNaseH-like domain protein [Caudoviricetes sp.]